MNTKKFINYLKNKNIYIISPHFDDAVLSTGMLLHTLKKYKNTTIVNVFTKAPGGRYTLSAKKFLKEAGYSDAAELFKARELEDKKAVSILNTKRANLGMIDALFRKKKKRSFLGQYLPEFDHVYPTYRWHVIGKINPQDQAIKELTSKLKKIIPPHALIFSPFGIGGHIDHLITRTVCENIFKNIFYYIDFPYNIRLKNSGTPPYGYKKFKLNTDLSKKSSLIHYYSSQVYGLFPQGKIPGHDEIYFHNQKI